MEQALEITWQWKEGPCTGLPSLTEQTQRLIRPPSTETLKCWHFELKHQSLKLFPGASYSVADLTRWTTLS